MVAVVSYARAEPSTMLDDSPCAAVCRSMDAHVDDWALVVRIALHDGRLTLDEVRKGMGVSGHVLSQWITGAGSPPTKARAGALRALKTLVRSKLQGVGVI